MEELECGNEQYRDVPEEKPCLDNSGMSTVEIILILVVLIALVIIFKGQITALVNTIFQSINKSAATIY